MAGRLDGPGTLLISNAGGDDPASLFMCIRPTPDGHALDPLPDPVVNIAAIIVVIT